MTEYEKTEHDRREEARFNYLRGGDPANPNPMPLEEKIKLFVEANLPEIYHEGLSTPSEFYREGDAISHHISSGSEHPLIQKGIREGVLEGTLIGPANRYSQGWGMMLWYHSGRKQEADEIAKNISIDMKRIGFEWIQLKLWKTDKVYL